MSACRRAHSPTITNAFFMLKSFKAKWELNKASQGDTITRACQLHDSASDNVAGDNANNLKEG